MIELPRRFVNTAAALIVFDAGVAIRAAARAEAWKYADYCKNAMENPLRDSAILADTEALDALWHVFHEETKHLKVREFRGYVTVRFIRSMVAKDGLPSIAFKAGMEAKKAGQDLSQSELGSLRPSSLPYVDFIAGYDYVTLEGVKK